MRAATGVFHVLGPDASTRAMRRLATSFAMLPANRKRLDRARSNIAWSFPEFSPEEVDRYAVESYRHLFCLASEITLAPRLVTTTTYDSLIEFGDVAPALREAVADRPVLLVTGHCGNWEVLGYAVAMLGLPMHALYRPLDMAPLDRWVRRTRERRGLRLVDKFGAAQKLPSLVASHKLVAFIADQNAGDRGLFVPFFDRLASAYKTIGVLALRYNASVVCGQALRVDREPADTRPGHAHAPRYRVDVVDAIGPDDWKDQPDPLFYITARYRRAIETMVRRAPEQYLWMHRYWKSRPRHEREGEAFPDRLRDKLAALPWMEDDALERLIERSERDARENSRVGAGSV